MTDHIADYLVATAGLMELPDGTLWLPRVISTFEISFRDTELLELRDDQDGDVPAES